MNVLYFKASLTPKVNSCSDCLLLQMADLRLNLYGLLTSLRRQPFSSQFKITLSSDRKHRSSTYDEIDRWRDVRLLQTDHRDVQYHFWMLFQGVVWVVCFIGQKWSCVILPINELNRLRQFRQTEVIANLFSSPPQKTVMPEATVTIHRVQFVSFLFLSWFNHQMFPLLISFFAMHPINLRRISQLNFYATSIF